MQRDSGRIGEAAARGRLSAAAVLAAAAWLLAGPAKAEDPASRFETFRFDARASSTQSIPTRRAAPVQREVRAPRSVEAFASGGAPATRIFTSGAVPATRAFTPRPVPPKPVGTGLKTVCVRLCDGYHFPVGSLASRSDLPIHQAACDAACPGAPVKLFMTPRNAGIERAVAEDKTLYRRLKTAFAYKSGVSDTCSCTGPDRIASRLPILQDRTLRRGDAYVTGVEAKVFAGDRSAVRTAAVFQDLGRANAMTRSARRKLHAMLEGNRRARAEIASAPVTAVASAFAPVRRVERAGSFQVAQAPGRGFAVVDGSEASVKAVRVVVRSPYRDAR